MRQSLHLGTRKGYFRLDREGDQPWRIARTEFLGVQVPMLLPDPRDGSLYAAVEHGHFGTKLHNGIFRSTDGCASWQRITNDQPADFGFGVAVDPAKGDRAWFVPGVKDEVRIPVDGKLVVTRTDDGGTRFTSLAQGLPQAHAYHLIYRHALDIDPGGRRLAMGSTTGSLWTSDDAGDSWSHFSPDLPPVFCVRFG